MRSTSMASDGGIHTLAVISGRTKFIASMEFGPKKGLLGEDTLGFHMNLPYIDASADGLEKIWDRIRLQKGRSSAAEPPRLRKSHRWSPRSLPRVSVHFVMALRLMGYRSFCALSKLDQFHSNPAVFRSASIKRIQLPP